MSKGIFIANHIAYCSGCGDQYKSDVPEQNCGRCNTQLVQPTLSYKNIWMSPSKAIIRFQNLMQKHGTQLAINHNQFQPEREAWVSAVWSLGYNTLIPHEYWIEIASEVNTPDVFVYFLDVIGGNNHRRIINHEIVEWEVHIKNIKDVIKAKCSKSYPDYFHLLVYMRHPNLPVDIDELVNYIPTLNPPFSEIWLIGALTNGEYVITKVYPDIAQAVFNLVDELNKNSTQRDFVKYTQRNTGTNITPLGTLYLPIPDLKG